MDLALQFHSLIKLADAHLQCFGFGESVLRTTFDADRRIRLNSSMGRAKRGFVCCKKPVDERTSNPSVSVRQEEIISLFRRIQSSISKESKSQDGSSENESLSKAILEKQRNDEEGDAGVKEESPKKQVKVARPWSSFAKKSPVRPSSSGPRGKPPASKSDKAMTEKVKKAPLIETMKLAELKEVAKDKGIKGYSKMKKSELLELLRSF